MKHQVQITGIAGQQDPDRVATAFAPLFHISVARARQLLSQLPLVVKGGLDAETAGRYRVHLEAIGLEVAVSAVMTLAEELVLAVTGEAPAAGHGQPGGTDGKP